MIRKLLYTIFSILLVGYCSAQSSKLPIKVWPSSSNGSAILFVSGDGGIRGLSINLCQTLNRAGHYLTAIDARSYFWEKKLPEETAKEFSSYLMNSHNQEPLVLIGYSFGADVLPFIVNRLPSVVKGQIKAVLLLSPSISTDFEIHISDFLGVEKMRSMNVVSEINRMSDIKVVTFFGSEERGFPLKDIHLNNHSNEVLPGGHHFDKNVNEVAKAISKYL